MFVCRYVKQFCLWSNTAALIGSGKYSFDTPEQRKDAGFIFGALRATGDRANACNKCLVQAADQTNGRIRLKFGRPIATIGGLNPFR